MTSEHGNTGKHVAQESLPTCSQEPCAVADDGWWKLQRDGAIQGVSLPISHGIDSDLLLPGNSIGI